MYLLVDNYDSFTYNLVALLKAEGADVRVVQNDEPVVLPENVTGIVLSPGPSDPDHAGQTLAYIREFRGRLPIFGVCLGMQAIGQSMGFRVRSARTIQHGKTDRVRVAEESVLFKGVKSPFTAVRYHSLAVDADPGSAPVTATAESDGEIMAIEDPERMLFGVQFHPESILSEQGRTLVRNFMAFCDQTARGTTGIDPAVLLRKLGAGTPLSFRESTELFSAMMTGGVTEVQAAAVLTALAVRGETADEIAGAAAALNRHKLRFQRGNVAAVDTCGTGGDGKHCMNVSTAVSCTLAAMGVPVVKHGNRAMSGAFGSADILESLDIPVGLPRDAAERQFAEHGFTFLFAPAYHPAVRQVAPVRKALGFRTMFNLIGPLANPADPPYQVIGLADAGLLDRMAAAAATMSRKRVVLYASEDGYDEVSSAAPTRCIPVEHGTVGEHFVIDPAEFFPPRPMPVVRTPEEAELAFMRAVTGSDGDLVNLVALNTALALVTCDRAADLHAGFEAAREALSGGTVNRFLKRLRENPSC